MPLSPPILPPRKDNLEDITRLNYFHPEVISINHVRDVMIPYQLHDSYFILRRSFSKPTSFTVSLLHNHSIKHFNISNALRTYFLQADTKFTTISSLIEYYGLHEVPNMEGIRNIRLLYPIYYDKDPLASMRRSYKHGATRVSRSRHSSDISSFVSNRDSRKSRSLSSPVESDHYSYAGEDKLESHVDELINSLKLNADRCDCGLLVSESQLPFGWTVHISREPQTKGRMFFMSGDGNKTAWNLPLDISVALNSEQQLRIRSLMERQFNRQETIGGVEEGDDDVFA